MKIALLLGTLMAASATFSGTTNVFLPNTTSPQTPGVRFYPALQKGYEMNYFNRPPTSNVSTGNDKSSTLLSHKGFDTTPVDDTGTEKDITYITHDPNRNPFGY